MLAAQSLSNATQLCTKSIHVFGSFHDLFIREREGARLKQKEAYELVYILKGDIY